MRSLKLDGEGKVRLVDVAPYRLDKARELGAAEVLDAGKGEVVPRLRAFGGGRGVDVAIEAVGRPETAWQCFEAVRRGGTVVFNGEQGPIELSPSDHFIRRDVTAMGAWYYHVCEFPQMVALQRQGLAVERLVSHEFPARDAGEAFAQFAAARTAKVLLRWRD